MHTNPGSRFLVAALLAALVVLAGHSAQAQLVNDGATKVISGISTNVPGDLTVGNVGPNTTLIVTNGGSVTANNAVTGGGSAASTNNLIAVSGAGSKLTTGGPFSVLRTGNASAFNRLFISGGGVVSNGYGVIGYPANASNNTALVTGSGSTWINNVLYVGENGSGNSLSVASGAQVTANNSTIGVVAGASSNRVTVTDSNSVWTTADTLNVGGAGGLSQLVVSNGGMVASTSGVLGYNSTSSNNSVLVTGAGSLWTNSVGIFSGYDGSGNQLLVTNGGSVFANFMTVGQNPASLGNNVTVDGGTLRLFSTPGNIGLLDVRRGTTVLNAGLIEADRLFLTSGLGLFYFNGGTLITHGGTVSNGQDFVVGNNVNPGPVASAFVNASGTTIHASGAASPYPSVINVANVPGNISKVTVRFTHLTQPYPDDLDILLVGPNGQKVMLMSDAGGGTPISSVNLMFDDSAATAIPDETPITSGTNRPADYEPGDLLPSSAPPGPYSTSLAAFNGSSANGAWSLFIVNDGGFDVGSLDAWRLDFVTTTDPTWDVRSNATPTTVAGTLYLGFNAANSTLLITNGGTLAVSSADVGEAVTSTNNRVVVSGPGSTWTNSGLLKLGYFGSGNQLVVSNGAVVTDSGASMASIGGTGDNVAVVTGPGSHWNNQGGLTVGSFGSRNQLTVSNGGVVTNTSGAIGFQNGANSNMVVVTDPGSLWDTRVATFYVARQGSANQLVVSNGGVVVSGDTYFGATVDAKDNVAIVTGAGSLWTNNGFLYVGQNASGSRLLIADGGTLTSSNIYVGLGAGSFNNRLTVDGGALLATGPAGNVVLDIRHGTNVLNAGLIAADQLVLNNGAGFFEFNGGTLNAGSATVANGTPFTVGNGSSAATYFMSGSPTNVHQFSDDLVIANSATLSGNGLIKGYVTVAPGATLSPGASIGTITLQVVPILQGKIIMEISKSGGILANDFINIGDILNLGGSLVVTNIGPDALAAGDSFKLFSTVGPIEGVFSSLTLPPLPSGLSWTNKLLVNGSIAVVVKTVNISSVTRNGTNLIFNVTGGSPGESWNLLTSTNVALSMANWITNRSGVFDWLGNVALTNGISATEPQRYFRFKTP